MRRRTLAAVVLSFAIPLVSCGDPANPPPDAGSAAPVFGADPLATTTSDSGALTIELRTSPQPPSRGTVDAQLVIRGVSGPVDGLAIDVVPWMVAMGHGASVVPEVTPAGSGIYLVRRLSLFMPGEWQLRLSVAGARNDRAMFTVMVP